MPGRIHHKNLDRTFLVFGFVARTNCDKLDGEIATGMSVSGGPPGQDFGILRRLLDGVQYDVGDDLLKAGFYPASAGGKDGFGCG